MATFIELDCGDELSDETRMRLENNMKKRNDRLNKLKDDFNSGMFDEDI